ncbi:MAG: phosphate ABC transporter substrate-binding protein [Bacteroidota bacterium]
MRSLRWMLLTTALFATAVAQKNDVLTVKGSDTMVLLAQRWAEVYMSKNPNVTLQVTGGGSGTGISALINGTTDICNASRPMKPSEKQKLKQRFNSLGVEIKAAKDGLSVYVNETNPVRELTLEQVRRIYVGEISNWKEVGGHEGRIILYSRENNSGTYVYFKDNILGGEDYAPNTQSLPGTAAVVNAVSKDKNGIGYGGAAYGKGIRELSLKVDAGSPAYAPTPENVRTGVYPITRFLFMYVRSRPTGAMKTYIDWILSDEGQSVVESVGYFPLR